MVPFYDIDQYIDFRNLVFPSPLAIAPTDVAALLNAVTANEVIPDTVVDASIAPTYD